jgi:hypothetical protein
MTKTSENSRNLRTERNRQQLESGKGHGQEAGGRGHVTGPGSRGHVRGPGSRGPATGPGSRGPATGPGSRGPATGPGSRGHVTGPGSRGRGRVSEIEEILPETLRQKIWGAQTWSWRVSFLSGVGLGSINKCYQADMAEVVKDNMGRVFYFELGCFVMYEQLNPASKGLFTRPFSMHIFASNYLNLRVNEPLSKKNFAQVLSCHMHM